LTGSGLAAFAQTGVGRLLLFQASFALAAALTLVWCLRVAWIPVIEKALAALPSSGAEIRTRRLLWPDSEAVLLASSPHLALAVDPTSSSQLGQNGDVQVELRGIDLRFRGLLGQVVTRYPGDFLLPLDRTGATAAWGAWSLPILTLVGVGTGLGLVVIGWLLALLYAPVLVFFAWITRRPLGFAEAWKLGLASLMPASLLMDLGLILYARHWLGLISITAVFGIHILAGWVAAFWGLSRYAPKIPDAAVANPFGKETMSARVVPVLKPRNPFDH